MREKAFSLIELLVVMAIIAILAVIAIPQYNKFRANAFWGKMETNLKNAKAWAQQIKADYDKYPSGTCDASSVSGTLKCDITSATNLTITTKNDGTLKVDSPLSVCFKPQSSCDGILIVVKCPNGKCSGLEKGSNGAALWINTCENPEKLHCSASLFNCNETVPQCP